MLASVDSVYVEARLLEAGRTLFALRVPGTWPGGYKSGMPEVVRDVVEAYGYTEADAPPATPSPRRIAEMEQALSWIRLIPADRFVLRRVVGARMLCRPNQERPLLSWRRIGERVGASHIAVRGWHAIGISIIVGALNAPGFCAATGGAVGGGRRDVELALRRVSARAGRRVGGRVRELV